MKQDKWSRSERNGLEHGVHLPEAAAWRSNAAWLAGRPFTSSFLAQSANQFFLLAWTYVIGKTGPQLIVKHRGRESRTMSAKAQPGMVRAGRGKD
jgi:hypothetical protein